MLANFYSFLSLRLERNACDARLLAAGVLYHTIGRDNERQETFLGKSDYQKCLGQDGCDVSSLVSSFADRMSESKILRK